GLAREQVLELHVSDLRVHDAALRQLGERRHYAMTHPRLGAVLNDTAYHPTRSRRDGHQNLVHLVGTEEPRQLVDGSQYRSARDPSSLLARIVVHEAYNPQAVARAAFDLFEEPNAGAPRADDEHQRVDASHRRARLPFANDTHRDGEPGDDEGTDDEVDREHRARYAPESRPEHDCKQE